MKLSKKHLRAAAVAVLALVFLFSTGNLIKNLLDSRQGAIDYEEASNLVELPDLFSQPAAPLPTKQPEPPADSSPAASDGVPEEESDPSQPPQEEEPDPYTLALWRMDFTALQEVNPDVVGWIVIPGTSLSYPLMQGEDNNFYLDHTWKKTYSGVGSIYLDSLCPKDLSGFNTIAYGHRMLNGSMFGMLKYYNSDSYRNQHPYVYLATEEGSFRYEIFAAYEAPVDSMTYRVGLNSERSRQAFLDECLDRSVLNTGIVPSVSDRILTLSTCTGKGYEARWVVLAYLPSPAPAEPEAAPEPETSAGPETAPEPDPSVGSETAPESEADSETPGGGEAA